MIKRTPGNSRPFKEKEFTNLVPKPISEIVPIFYQPEERVTSLFNNSTVNPHFVQL
jgi:hypothetical protein